MTKEEFQLIGNFENLNVHKTAIKILDSLRGCTFEIIPSYELVQVHVVFSCIKIWAALAISKGCGLCAVIRQHMDKMHGIPCDQNKRKWRTFRVYCAVINTLETCTGACRPEVWESSELPNRTRSCSDSDLPNLSHSAKYYLIYLLHLIGLGVSGHHLVWELQRVTTGI